MAESDGKVVVITGASSGIGRLTALRFASLGATTALVARDEGALEETAQRCHSLGGRSFVLPVDVADAQAMTGTAETIVTRFGRIDVWVNNAAVSAYGRFEEIPDEDFRRVIETNLLGYVNGSRAVLPHFKRQGFGTLIQVGSVNCKVPVPFSSPYVISKFGIRALSDCLRQELRRERDIHVCLVLPAAIDTPFFQHAANFSGRAIQPLKPVSDPDRVADAIVDLARKPRRERPVGRGAYLMLAGYRLSPSLSERLAGRMGEVQQLRDEPAVDSHGTLFETAGSPHAVSGGWKGRRILPWIAGGAAALGLVAWLAGRETVAPEEPMRAAA